MIRYSWAILLVLLPLLVKADVYEHYDVDGNVTYTDQPVSNAKKVELPPVSVVSSSKLGAASARSSGEYQSLSAKEQPDQEGKLGPVLPEEKAVEIPALDYYKTFSITAPTADQTFYNQRSIPVQASLEPALRTGNTIQFLLDGRPYGQALSSVTTTLSSVNRGEHTVQAQLFDKNGKVVKSTEMVTIYIHYTSIQ